MCSWNASIKSAIRDTIKCKAAYNLSELEMNKVINSIATYVIHSNTPYYFLRIHKNCTLTTQTTSAHACTVITKSNHTAYFIPFKRRFNSS